MKYPGGGKKRATADGPEGKREVSVPKEEK